jgi:hypothetical protein
MILSNDIEKKYVLEMELYFFSFEQSGESIIIHDFNLPDRLAGNTGISDAIWKALKRNFEKVSKPFDFFSSFNYLRWSSPIFPPVLLCNRVGG